MHNLCVLYKGIQIWTMLLYVHSIATKICSIKSLCWVVGCNAVLLNYVILGGRKTLTLSENLDSVGKPWLCRKPANCHLTRMRTNLTSYKSRLNKACVPTFETAVLTAQTPLPTGVPASLTAPLAAGRPALPQSRDAVDHRHVILVGRLLQPVHLQIKVVCQWLW